MPRFTAVWTNAFEEELLRAMLNGDVVAALHQMFQRVQANPYLRRAYAIDTITIYVTRRQSMQGIEPLYLAYSVAPPPKDPEGIAGIVIPIVGGLARPIFGDDADEMLVVQANSYPIAVEKAAPPPPELERIVRRIFQRPPSNWQA